MNEECIYLSGEEKQRYLEYKNIYEPEPSNLDCDATITSIEEFQKFLKQKIGARISDCVFRGEEDYKGNKGLLTPYISRPNNKEINEKNLINGLMNEKIDEFIEIENSLDALIKMQHYGIPTRLLDISFNPYKSLYFSLENPYLRNKRADGYFYIINTSDKPIIKGQVHQKLERKTVNSDTVSIVSSLARLNEYEDYPILRLYNFIKLCELLQMDEQILQMRFKTSYSIEFEEYEEDKEKIRFLNKKLYKSFESGFNEFKNEFRELKKIISRSDYSSLTKNLKKFYDSAVRNGNRFLTIEYNAIMEIMEKVENEFTEATSNLIDDGFNKEKEQREIHEFEERKKEIHKLAWSVEATDKLIHEVKYYNAGFINRIEIDDLFKDYLIMPRNNNQRIINQEGGFILSGLKISSINTLCDSSEIIRLKIPIAYKEQMLKDLRDYQGISESFIYPELDHYNSKKF